MADRFPIIIESTEQQIQELSAGDGLDLTRSGVVNANYVHSAGVNAGVVTATSFIGDGSQITNIPAGGGSLEATASGTLADGSKVIVNADGTVSVVSQTTTAASVGSPVVFENSSGIYYSGATYDSTNGKVVIVYRDSSASRGKAIVGTVSGNSISFGSAVEFHSSASQDNQVEFVGNGKVVVAYQQGGTPYYGKCRVGTISGTSISFGTEVTFNSGNTAGIGMAYDSTNDKLVISYRDNGNSSHGTAIVGTVSGTSISFGSEVVFESAATYHISATFDSSNGKVVIAYYDDGNSGYGTAVVGTVSGTSISFGSPVVFNDFTTYISATFDSSNGKVVITFRDNVGSGTGQAIVGTVSGTSISFGSIVTFSSSNIGTTSATFDSSNSRVVIAYRDVGNSGYGTFVVGTVSGTSISFDSPTVFESASSYYISTIYDSTNQKVVIPYSDAGNSDRGTAVVYSPDTTTTNLTAENFIGISDGAYTNGQTATVQIAGSVDDAQSSLTPGQQYYVQGDGTLSETADTPSVLAGTAVAATKLMIG